MKFPIVILSLLLAVIGARSIPLYELNPAKVIGESNSKPGNLAEFAQAIGLTTLIDAAKKVKIDNVLANAPGITLFGPVNEAFGKIPPPIKPMFANDTLLKLFLFFHVLKGEVYASAIKNELLVPSIIDVNPKLNIRFNIYDNPGGVVVTAHCSKIILVNLNASNGVLHVLDNVMIPGNETIGAIVSRYSQYYSTLHTALVKAGLDKVLEGEGPFTLFAPVNDAFSKIPPATLNKILSNTTLLTKVLKYHVISGTKCVAGLYNKQKLTTLEGSTAEISFSPGVMMINNARVVYIDSMATNGVIQVIDNVLIPPDLEI